jgi:choline dehydrogenase-like flavoprotein
MAENTYDAIVVGSGISGGWAAKELTEKGLKVLMLERGEDVNTLPVIPTRIKIRGSFRIVVAVRRR